MGDKPTMKAKVLEIVQAALDDGVTSLHNGCMSRRKVRELRECIEWVRQRPAGEGNDQ